MLDLVVFGSLCGRDGLRVVFVPGRGSSSGLSGGQWGSVRVRRRGHVVCTVVGCMFSITSNRVKTDHGHGCGSPTYLPLVLLV